MKSQEIVESSIIDIAFLFDLYYIYNIIINGKFNLWLFYK